jgi:hypothetical protein
MRDVDPSSETLAASGGTDWLSKVNYLNDCVDRDAGTLKNGTNSHNWRPPAPLLQMKLRALRCQNTLDAIDHQVGTVKLNEMAAVKGNRLSRNARQSQ